MPKSTTLAQRITDARVQHGMSKSALAKMVGVTPAAVGAWEEGRASPRAPMLALIAKVFGMETEALLSGGGRSAKPAGLPAPMAASNSGSADQILMETRGRLAALWKLEPARVVVTVSVSTK